MDLRCICLPLKDQLLRRYWRNPRRFWPGYCARLQAWGFNAVLFWPYSPVPQQGPALRLWQWIFRIAQQRRLRIILYAAGHDVDWLRNTLRIYPGISFCILYPPRKLYPAPKDPPHPFDAVAEALKKENIRAPFLQVRGYGNSPHDIAQARREFQAHFPKGELWVSHKFSFEHFMGTQPCPSNRWFAAESPGRLATWIQSVGDQDPFLFHGPNFVRDCVRNARRLGINGFILDPPHWWTFPRTTDRRYRALVAERDRVFYEAFGRYLQDPAADEDDRWDRQAATDFGVSPVDGRRLVTVGNRVARFIPEISEMFFYNWDFNYYPVLAANNETFVPARDLGGLFPRLKRYPSLAAQIGRAQVRGLGACHVTEQERLTAAMAEGLRKSAAMVGGLASRVRLQRPRFACIRDDTAAAAQLAEFWRQYVAAVASGYRYIGGGDRQQLQQAQSAYRQAILAYGQAAKLLEQRYRGVVAAIFDKVLRWSQIRPQIKADGRQFLRRLETFARIPVLLAGKLYEYEMIWYPRYLKWPFEDRRVEYFPVYDILPFTIRRFSRVPAHCLLVVGREVPSSFVRHKARLWEWVRRGGHILFYDMHAPFPEKFLPSPLVVGRHSDSWIQIDSDASPLTAGLQHARLRLELGQTRGEPGKAVSGACAVAWAKAWRVSAWVEREYDDARPAVILDLPLGKGGIGFCGLHVTHRDRYGGPGNEQKYKHTKFEKTLTTNWLKWAGLRPHKDVSAEG